MNMPAREKKIKDRLFELKKLSLTQVPDSQRLRYDIYVREKGWEPPNGLGLEADSYDDFSHHFGVYVGRELVGSVRLIDGRKITLPIFSQVLFERERNCVEISRIVVRKGAGIPGMLISEWMYSYVLYFFLLNRYAAAYAFMQEKHFRIMNSRWREELDFEQIGSRTEYKQGYLYVPVKITLNPKVWGELFPEDLTKNWTLVG